MSNTGIKYSKQLVLFIDVLGTKNNCDEQLLRTFHQAYKNAIYDVSFDNSFQNNDNLKIAIFSDNVAIVDNCENYDLKEKQNVLHNMILFAITFQNDLLREGYLTRGGIAYGDCFIDNVMIMGQALIDAYMLESKLALYPRIIVSESLIKDFKFLEYHERYLSKDKDEKYFVDYLLYTSKNESGFLARNYRFVKENIEKKREEPKKQNVNKISIVDKYIWVKEKLDKYCKLGEQNERNER